MIINNPTKLDFENVSKENLTQSFNLLFLVYSEYTEYTDGDEIIAEEVSIEDIWKHHNGTLRTSLILLHQAIEGLMKSVICETSPLLLIDKPRKDWPTLPAAEDKDFDSLYTIGGETLLTTFCAVNSIINRTSDLINFIEEIRKKRNQAIHGTNIINVTPKYIIENILTTFTTWFGKDSWLRELKKNLFEHPLFGYSNYESAISYRFLNFSLFIVGKNFLSKHVSPNIHGREYFCPECKHNIEGDFGKLESKWAFLNPNEPTSNEIFCANCQENFKVIRKKCNKNECKGNVLYDDADYTGELLCLTCFESQE